MNAEIRLLVINVTIAERHREADLARLARPDAAGSHDTMPRSARAARTIIRPARA